MPYINYTATGTIWPTWVTLTNTAATTATDTSMIWPTWVESTTTAGSAATTLTDIELTGVWRQCRVSSYAWRALTYAEAIIDDAQPIPRRPITEERRAAIAEREREREAAVAAAEALLRENLDPVQLESYDALQTFLVNAPSGCTYQIRKGIAGNVDVIEDGKTVGRYCIHLAIDVPAQDNMLAQKLLLEHDEKAFRRIGNYTPVRQPAAAA